MGISFGLLGAGLVVLLDPSMHNTITVDSATPRSLGSGWGHVALLTNTFSSSSLFVLRKWTIGKSGITPMYFVTSTHLLAMPLLLLLTVLASTHETFCVVIGQGGRSLLKV